MLVRYLSHPQVFIEPQFPVPDWSLSALGIQRVYNLLNTQWIRDVGYVMSSPERKAMETAQPIAKQFGLDLRINAKMHENDRSSTGYLPPLAFERTVTEFMKHPNRSIRGWESAVHAQARIVEQVEVAVKHYRRLAPLRGDILLVGHGGVGTLLYCHFAGLDIDRKFDQPPGGGNYITIDWTDQRVLHGWLPMEESF
ncbi:histidine phosphatase family protein [Cohaesibacter celericrescens]|nr:histidine phosphatase family protein [Cohaesibacter celericrescens]